MDVLFPLCNDVSPTHPFPLFEEHSEDLLGEEEEVEAGEHHRRFGHVEVHHGVKTEGLPSSQEEKTASGC